MADGPWNDFATLDSQRPAAGPWAAYAQPAANDALTSVDESPAQRSAAWTAQEMKSADSPLIKYPLVAAGTLSTFAHGAVQQIADFFKTGIKAASGQQPTPEEEISAGLVAAGMTSGGFMKPHVEAIAPALKSFDDGVIAPAAQRLDSYARTGDPNGVRLEPPAPEVKPEPIRPIEGSPFAGVPRSVAAKTGVPEVDSVLGSPVTKSVIDNAVIDRSHDVPYMAGGSNPLNDPTVYIDRHVPKEQTVGGVTFDPAEPWSVHENVEQHTMEILTRNGMTDGEAYRVAHFEFAEPAEQAWYRAHGIDQVAAEKEQASWLPRIQHENPENPPPNLYEKPYPHMDVRGAEHESVEESPPTPEEKARAFDIIRNAPELRPKSAAPMLAEARELGVIGEEPPRSLNQLPPKEAGQRAMGEGQPPGRGGGGESDQPERSAWRKRWEQTLDKMATKDDVRRVLGGIIDANDEFAAARQGDMRPVEIERMADVTGLDPTKIDVAGTSAKIKNNVELARFTEAFRVINDKIQQAAHDFAGRRGIDDQAEAAEFTRLQLQRQLLLDSTVATKGLVALRAEWGRAGNTLREFYRAQREAEGVPQNLKNIDDLREQARLVADAPPNALPRVLILSPLKPQPWYFWAFQNMLISGLVTHTKYAFVNTGELFLDHIIAPEVAAVYGKVRGERAAFGAPLDAYNAIVRSVPDAFITAKNAFVSGQRVPLLSEWELAKRQLENPEAKAAQTPYVAMSPDWGIWKKVFNDEQLAKAEKAIGVFGRSANALHSFFKVLGERGSAASTAYRTAFDEGLSPLSDNQKFWERYDYHAANPTDEALKATIDSAYEGTFMEKLGEQTRVFAELARNTPLKWIFVFTHIPMNIARSAVRYSPLAAATLPFEGSLIGQALRGELGASAQNLALAKVSVGTAVGTYFIDQALKGNATGDYPTDAKERARWKLLNIQPNSIKVDGEWRSLERMGPVAGTVPRIAANYAAIIKQYEGGQDESLMKAAFYMALGTASVLTDEVGFQAVRNIVQTLENPKQAARTASYQIASYINPLAMSAQLASAHDPYMREADTLLKALQYRTPYLREELAPKRDPLYGEPVPNPGYASVQRSVPTNVDPVKNELDRLQYYPAAPERTIGHVKLTDEQYDRYEATAGPLVKQMLNAAISGPRYAQMPDVAKQALLKGIISAGRARARQAMQMAYPQLIQQGIDARRAQITGATP